MSTCFTRSVEMIFRYLVSPGALTLFLIDGFDGPGDVPAEVGQGVALGGGQALVARGGGFVVA